MRTYIADIIPNLQRFSQKLDNQTLLTNQHWVVIDEITSGKTVYIFRPNNELLISKNGKVEKAKWEYLGKNSLLIDLKDGSYLFRHGFFDENILALKVDGKKEYAFLINEPIFEKGLNTIDNITNYLSNYQTSERFIKNDNNDDHSNDPKLVSSNFYEIIPKGLFAGKYDQHIIHFKNGSKGAIYMNRDDLKWFFRTEEHRELKQLYNNKDNCINGLFIYLKNGKIEGEGYLGEQFNYM